MEQGRSYDGNAALLELARNGDRAAMDRLIEDNLPLVRAVCRRFYGRGVEAEDLFQTGCVGLIKAARRFDPAYGVRFSTYAVPVIMGEIRRFLRDDGPIKVSRRTRELAARLWAASRELNASLGREPTLSELCARVGVTAEEAAAALNAAEPISLSDEVADGLTVEDTLAACDDGQFERLALRQSIASLGERERELIALRFRHGLTQQRTARIMGTSQVQISRMEKRIKERLKREIG